MASYQKKYLTLKEASIISGYTVKELRNFCKIGLVPSRKYKAQTLIRFDAFEKLECHGSPAEPKSPSASAKKSVVAASKPNMSLLPFKTPNRQLVSVLQPVALAATLVMVLYIASVPQNAEQIIGAVLYPAETANYMADSSEDLINTSVEIGGVALSVSEATLSYTAGQTAGLIEQTYEVAGIALTVSEDTLAYMGGSVSGLMEQTYALTSLAVDKFASMPVYAARPLEDVHAERVARSAALGATGNEVEMVAGIATADGTFTADEQSVSGVEGFLISVADGADQFQRLVTDGPNRAFDSLVQNLRFESIDSGISETFRW